jgi:3-isopropylmalate/(R)-2-methylmalate dehydratase large subunit
MALTLFEKLWRAHKVCALDESSDLIYIDRVFLHERTGSIALQSLAQDQRRVMKPEHVFCTMDHIVDTLPGRGDKTMMPSGTDFIVATREACRDANITLFDVNHPDQGIVHVVSPELGIVQPGCTLVCPDSHTCSQGALGALAWGIGSSEAEHAMATKTLRVAKPKTMQVIFEGRLSEGVSAKDMILHLISRYGAAGGAGYVIEFCGQTIDDLEIEARLTLCNMAVEFSAFTGLIAPDEKAVAYLKGRRYSPQNTTQRNAWDEAVKYWDTLRTDDGASFDKVLCINSSLIVPTVTWGTSPQHASPVDTAIPNIEDNSSKSESARRALTYMGLSEGTKLIDIDIDAAFIGSCTNSRISDLRLAAKVLKGKHIAPNVKAICVPGSSAVKRQAEEEGLDKIFTQAGFEWREAGCSMCFYAGGENFGDQKRIISSTNRNFEGRQGPRSRTHLASPATVAASAIEGKIADVRGFFK